MTERVLAYDIGLDERIPVNGFYIKRQVETHIGERLNVLLSRTRYELRDGIIYGQSMDEPFLDVLKRGRDYRRKYGNEADWDREDAEVVGFSTAQEVLGNPNTQVGTKILSISNQGGEDSIYKHNYYDVFTLKDDGNERYIEARRYSSSLSQRNYKEIYEKLSGEKVDNPSDSFFLANPLIVNAFKDADEIHKFLHRDHGYTSEGDFEIILEICEPFILYYIKTLLESINRQDHAIAFNAILNKADKAAEDLPDIKNGNLVYFNKVNPFVVDRWGRLPVQQKMTGCGASNGFSIEKGSTDSPFGVSEFGETSKNKKCNCLEGNHDNHYHCPDCDKKYADETHKKERTEKCPCGFKFAC